MIQGKLEITIKINQFPTEVKTVTNGWKQFSVEADGREVSITVRPKVWNKLEEAQKSYPQWVGAITGKLGEITPQGFVLTEPTIQVFEKKPKQEAPEKPPTP
jgi:hypothetical protein